MSRKILVIGLLILLLALGSFVFLQGKNKKNASLLIETQPSATVFLDGEQVGTTPFKTERKPDSVTIKLIPFAESSPLAPYQTEVTLISGIETVIRRNFAQTDDASSGEVLFFDKVGGKAASVAVVSVPEGAQLSIDGKTSGFTPIKVDAVDIGQHTLQVSANGFTQRDINVQTIGGYKLTAVVKLAKLEEKNKEENTTPQNQPEKPKTQIEILTTPTGFLRVRFEPSTSATESARVTPGKRYNLIEENSDGSWYKIEFEENKSGWISSQYAKKVE